MRAWLLVGPILMAFVPSAAGAETRVVSSPSPPTGKPAVRVIDVTSTIVYRLPAAVPRPLPGQPALSAPDRRIDRALLPAHPVIVDPQAASVRNALRDRLARRGGALSGGLEWRLNGNGSDLGLGGGLKRIVDAVLDD